MSYEQIECKICSKKMSMHEFGRHLKKCHNMTYKEYYDTYIEPNVFHKCCCDKCNNEAKFISITKGYAKCCSQKCANCYGTSKRHEKEPIFGLEKAQKTNLKVYGNVCSLHGKKQHKMTLKTWKKNYGEDHPMKSKKVQDKILYTIIKKYKSKEEFYKHIQSEILEDLKKYGFNEDGSQKITNVFQLKSSKQISKKTKKKKYGDENYSNHEQACKTLMEKYGAIFNNPKFRYNGLTFDSSWELAYYIYLTDNNIDFTYHPEPSEKFKYYWSGDDKIHTYYPDFIIENNVIELKNQYKLYQMINEVQSKEHAKYKCMEENNVIIISNEDIKPYLDYIYNKYGKNYLEQYKVVKEKDG